MTSMNNVGRAVSRTLAIGAITALTAVALPAQAQQQPAQAQAEATLQEVVVTGSLIRRTDFETPSPIQVVTAQDLQQSGYTSVSDVLRNLAANGQGTLSQSFNFAFAGGGSGVALRGLTVGGTLTLVDGQRMIPYALSDDSQRNFVDVTSIPFNVVERIDVLKDGASAEYGSDAVAGVVNVVLRKTFTGVSITADAGTTSKSDGTTEHLAGIWGTGDLASDGYNAYLAVEFRHQDNILVKNRSGFWTNLDWRPYGGFDTRIGANNIAGGNSRPAIPGGYVLDPTTNALDANMHFLNPKACANYGAFIADQCIWQGDDQIQPQTGNLDALGRITKNLAGDWQAIGTASLFRSEAEQVQGARQTNVTGSPRTDFGYGPGITPFAVNVPRTVLPPGAPNNPFPFYDGTGAAAQNLGALANTLGGARMISDFMSHSPTTHFVNYTYRFFGELRGTAAGWDIDGTLGWMYDSVNQKTTGAYDRTALSLAAANNFNFVNANYSQMAATFAPETEVKDTNTMEVADLHGTHELAELPGGALSVALGAGMNHLYKNSLAAPGGSSGLQAQVNGAYVLGGQTNTNAYIEFVAPLFKGFEFDAAGRYDRYNQYGSSTTPKVGIKYTPFKLVSLRGTYGKGFRAPNPAESGISAAAFGGAPFNDANLCPNPANPTAAGNFPSQCNLGLAGLTVGTRTLQPEKSTNWTAGLIFTPFDATSISFDYWDIKVNQDIQAGTTVLFLGGDPALFPITYGALIALPFCTANNVCNTDKITPAPGPVLYQAFPYYNLTQTHVNGLDVDLLSKFEIGAAGRLTAQLNASYMFHYIFGLPGNSFDLAGSHGPSIISGDTGNPKIRAVASLAWDLGPVNVTASVNYVGRFNVTDPTNSEPDCRSAFGAGGVFGGRFDTAGALVTQDLLNKYCEVSSFTDVDLYAQYAFTKRFSLHASVLNLLGTDPPVDMTTYGAAANIPYNPAMHQAGAVGRFFNLGATYTW